jgi:hypothetical protein
VVTGKGVGAIGGGGVVLAVGDTAFEPSDLEAQPNPGRTATPASNSTKNHGLLAFMINAFSVIVATIVGQFNL